MHLLETFIVYYTLIGPCDMTAMTHLKFNSLTGISNYSVANGRGRDRMGSVNEKVDQEMRADFHPVIC